MSGMEAFARDIAPAAYTAFVQSGFLYTQRKAKLAEFISSRPPVQSTQCT